MTSVVDAHQEAIEQYYDRAWLDYRVFWITSENLAFHLGYWSESTRSHAESLIDMNRAMADRISVSARDRVFDAGCGVGGTSLWLARERGARVVGVNIAPGQVTRAEEFARGRGLDALVRFERKDFLHSGFPDADFDVVWAQESVLHAPSQREFLAEAHRLLRPGGRLIVEDVFAAAKARSAEDQKLLETICAGCLIPDLPSSTDFVGWAQEVGFADVRMEDISRQVEPSFRKLRRILRFTYPMVLALRAVRLRAEEEVDMLRGLLAQYRALQCGVLMVGLCSAVKPGG